MRLELPVAELPVISEKGTPEVRPALVDLVISEKGSPLVQPENPELVISEKGVPEVQSVLPEKVLFEKGTPEVRPELPAAEMPLITEKGDPEVRDALPEYKFSIKTREDVTTLPYRFYNLNSIRMNEGEKVVTNEGKQGFVKRVFEDVVSEKGDVLASTLKSESREEPVNRVVRIGIKPINGSIGESGMYHLSEHNADKDIAAFNQGVTLNGDEIRALGQDEIDKRAHSNVENNLWVVSKEDATKVMITHAPLSDETIGKLNNGTFINHKNVGLKMLQLVNEERQRVGKGQLSWSDDLYKLTKIRAQELANNGHIRFWNDKNEVMKHVRDNKGTQWYTVTKGTPFEYRWLGENLAGYGLGLNPYVEFSEKTIAEKLFTQWKNSPGHYANMIDEHYKKFAFDMGYSTFWRNDGRSIDYLGQGVHGVQLFAN